MNAGRAHPAEVTCQRLVRHEEQWADRLTPAEREAFLQVRAALLRIGAEDEPEGGLNNDNP